MKKKKKWTINKMVRSHDKKRQTDTNKDTYSRIWTAPKQNKLAKPTKFKHKQKMNFDMSSENNTIINYLRSRVIKKFEDREKGAR